jgi:hypothetical protein
MEDEPEGWDAARSGDLAVAGQYLLALCAGRVDARAWRQQAAGVVFLGRYADDAVFYFQYQADAERYLKQVQERLAAHGLELHPEKTRLDLIEFGRYAEGNRRGGGRVGRRRSTFWGSRISAAGAGKEKFQVKRQTMGSGCERRC